MFFILRIFIIAVCREDNIVANIEVTLDAFNSISLFTHGTINGLESHNHLFFESGYTLEVWQQFKANLVYSVTPLRLVINIVEGNGQSYESFSLLERVEKKESV